MLAAIAMSDQMSLLDWLVVCIPLVAIVIIGCKVQGYVKSSISSTKALLRLSQYRR